MNQEVQRRIVGVDLLRIVSMMLLVLLNLLTQGGITDGAAEGSISRIVLTVIECAAYCALDAYALASGYAGGTSDYTRLILLWLQTLFYSFLLTLLLRWAYPETLGKAELLRSCFPLFSGQYWYFTAFFGLLLLKPILDFGLQMLSGGQLKLIAAALLLFTSLLPTLLNSDLFLLHGGYSVLWFVVLYVLGAYLYRCDPLHKLNAAFLLLMFAAFTALTCGEKLFWTVKLTDGGGFTLLSLNSPTLTAQAMILTLLCARVRNPSAMLEKWTGIIAPLTFGVYLLHTHPQLWRLVFWKGCFGAWADMPLLLLLPIVLVVSVGVFLVCASLDCLRMALFRLLKLETRLSKFEIKITSILK